MTAPLWVAEWDAMPGSNDMKVGDDGPICRVTLTRPEGGVYAVHVKPCDSAFGAASGIFACPDPSSVLIALDGGAVVLDVTTGEWRNFEAIWNVTHVVERADYLFVFAWEGRATIRGYADLTILETEFYPRQGFQSEGDKARVLLDKPPAFDVPIEIDMRDCEIMR